MFYVFAAAQHGHRYVDLRAKFHKADHWLTRAALLERHILILTKPKISLSTCIPSTIRSVQI